MYVCMYVCMYVRISSLTACSEHPDHPILLVSILRAWRRIQMMKLHTIQAQCIHLLRSVMCSSDVLLSAPSFHDDRFSHSSNTKVITWIISDSTVSVLLLRRMYESCRWGCFRWNYLRINLHNDQIWLSSNTKVINNGVFWDVTPCGSCKKRRFGVTASVVHRFLSPWWRKSYVPRKRRFLQEPHGVTSQKTPFFIVTAMKTSSLT
jgi:hypothetical protein